MRERPILFSAPMVRAILAGTKTQTRRAVGSLSKRHPLVNLAEHAGYGGEGYSGRFDDPHSWGWAYAEDGVHAPLGSWLEWCPYGQPGDRLWVRETFAEKVAHTGKPLGWAYRADGERADYELASGRWSPSIHMPRWASRITLEVTGVRVERLQAISRDDEVAEGVDAGQFYDSLWESINGPGSWAANPWVWVIEFKRLEARKSA